MTVVYVEGWEGELLMFASWRKTYMHLWDHIETAIERDARSQAWQIKRALEGSC